MHEINWYSYSEIMYSNLAFHFLENAVKVVVIDQIADMSTQRESLSLCDKIAYNSVINLSKNGKCYWILNYCNG